MANRIGIRQLRDTLTTTIRRVRAGESFEITHDGQPVALLSPIQQSRLERLIASGQVTLPKRPLLPLPDPVPVTGPMTASEALAEDRGD
jgi:antitoxin (DNA-binding transcriptional repressor) of toxin-antitoxin stability system